MVWVTERVLGGYNCIEAVRSLFLLLGKVFEREYVILNEIFW